MSPETTIGLCSCWTDNYQPEEDEMLTLYEHPFALYCQKVLIAFNELGVDYDVLVEQRDFDRADLAELWPPASIPVLRDGDRVIGETSIIIEYVAGARLVPSLEARMWDRICDQYISNVVQAIVSDTIEERFDQGAVERAWERLDVAYGMLESQLDGVEFLAGETFTIADCAAAPGLFYALAIHPWDEGTRPRLTRYYRALAQRPSFAKVIADARSYRPLFPLPWPDDFDRYH
ncbi:MAG: glutathione S-transferase family protein [Solirubrobacteraceae bacterium]